MRVDPGNIYESQRGQSAVGSTKWLSGLLPRCAGVDTLCTIVSRSLLNTVSMRTSRTRSDTDNAPSNGHRQTLSPAIATGLPASPNNTKGAQKRGVALSL